MVLIDPSKAFDSTRHSLLLDKLRALGASVSVLSWFKSYLSDRQQTTRVGPLVSAPFESPMECLKDPYWAPRFSTFKLMIFPRL